MNDAEREGILELFAKRQRQCQSERKAYQRWLDFLTPRRGIAVGGGKFRSALAGATVLGRPEFFGNHWPVVGGVLALTSSTLTGVHRALHHSAMRISQNVVV
jgi:hypothetical protein